MLLLIADISGYTDFMVTNKSTIGKSQMIIVELIKTIIAHLHIPLKIAKLEGDAVFLYAEKDGNDKTWDELLCCIGERLTGFFDIFTQKINELSQSVMCEDDACKIIDRLRVKIIVHYGTAEILQIGDFRELSGIDVILLHRLLKNRVKAPEYILMTEAALQEIKFPKIICVENNSEHCEGIGEVQTFVWYPAPYAHPAL